MIRVVFQQPSRLQGLSYIGMGCAVAMSPSEAASQRRRLSLPGLG
jgi:hypothetical protein